MQGQGMTWAEIEKRLEALEHFESLSKEEQANLLASIIVDMFRGMPPEQMTIFFKSWIMRNPDVLETLLEYFRSTWLKQYREAIKFARRRIRIRRK